MTDRHASGRESRPSPGRSGRRPWVASLAAVLLLGTLLAAPAGAVPVSADGAGEATLLVPDDDARDASRDRPLAPGRGPGASPDAADGPGPPVIHLRSPWPAGPLPLLVLTLGLVAVATLAGQVARRWPGAADVVRRALRHCVESRRPRSPLPFSPAGAVDGGSPDDATPEPTAGEAGDTDAASPDREVVRRLLAAQGGRLPQSDIVARTDWSKAKVSRLLSEMERAGDVVKVRLGRENLICVPGAEPPVAADPAPPPNE